MCIAIIEVTYRTSSPKELINNFADEEALATRLASLQENDQVSCIKIFRPETTLTRTITWAKS